MMRKLIPIAFIMAIFILTSTTTLFAIQNEYIVKSGDTLWEIANANGTTVNHIKDLNNLTSDSLIPGQVLALPVEMTSESKADTNLEPSRDSVVVTYTVCKGDSLSTIAAKYNISVEALMNINNLTSECLNPGYVLIISSSTGNTVSRSGDNIQAARLLEIAARHLGTPYRYGGQTPGGFDCSGFARYIFSQIGIDLPRTASAQYGIGSEISKDNLQLGDLLFFRCGSGGIDHVGIYTGNNQFIHSSSPRSGGVIYSSIAEGYYLNTYAGAKRILR
ncbi:MAG: LysM peptidoglycan-binding domain-containing protein [Syntrophomonadaceae bacterium]|nr:LysM peptidoglycan-binding domain-containing protein [Syntrophomonadaceae bacterium]